MNKKRYVCYVCGKEQIARKLPHGWHIITDGGRQNWVGYICNGCKIGINV